MRSRKKQKSNKKKPQTKTNLQELQESRHGGQDALRGYSYQFLYSCNLLLSSCDDTIFTLEGIEDIDVIEYGDGNEMVTHIQLKYSNIKQDASFMDGILKNFLETYLINKNRYFELVYDFSVSEGNLKKLLFGKLDSNSKKFWNNKIENIRSETSFSNWDSFDFDDFIQRLSFKNVKKNTIEKSIEDLLIKNFEIETDNISLFANGIKLLCFEKMEKRDVVTRSEIVQLIENIKFDISKGPQNPAHAWIQKIQFSKSCECSLAYYEGKKATPSDIANNLPVIRPVAEKKIIESISKNMISVIKTSSGQGKTTLALRAMYMLTDEYTPYQITSCNNDEELGYIIDYFRMRTRIGEKPLILFDNLDAHLSEWNLLAQRMQTEVTYHYKIIVTSRENDWYNYGGDVSNLRHFQIIKPVLDEKEARMIYDTLKKEKLLHENIKDWKNAWAKVADQRLLIEYVYLLTHGEMIAERISEQMKQIGNSSLGGAKLDILRKVCFADVCGIRLETKSLISNISFKTDLDIGELLKSLSEEFLVHISSDGDYIGGLHPVRSQHIINRLHEYISLDETALSIARIASCSDISVLFSHFPEFDFDKEIFYYSIVNMWMCGFDLSRFVQAIRGTFSGSVMYYFKNNKALFDDVQGHGGLIFVATDISPFSKFKDYEDEFNALEKISKIFPDNPNIKYLIKQRDLIPKFEISKTDIYFFCSSLYSKLKEIDFSQINDLDSYAIIVDWLYNIDSSMNLSLKVSLDDLWACAENYSLKAVSSLMYSSFCGNEGVYREFVKNNLSKILNYLKRKTNSHKILVTDDNKEIMVEYLLRARAFTKSNEESVSRLEYICRTLPIFETYCSDSIKPQIDFLSNYKVPDDAHKRMPKRNIIISFHKEFNNLWLRTIKSNYEFDTVYEWIDFWLDVRKCACDLIAVSLQYLHKILGNKFLGTTAKLFETLHNRYNNMLIAPKLYPREYRPFEKEIELPKKFVEIRKDYFTGIRNFADQLVAFINKDEKNKNLPIHNLKSSLAALHNVQKFFDDFSMDSDLRSKHVEFCANEEKILLETYMCCEYYLFHMPSNSYNKYQVKSWFLSTQKDKLDEVSKAIKDLTTSFDTVLPIRPYNDKIFMCYPILLKKFDLSNEEMMNKFLISCIPFAKFHFDYLLLLVTNDAGEVIPSAIKFPKKIFQYLYNFEDMGLEEKIDFSTSPYPVDVTQEMLKCFDGEYTLQEEKKENVWLSRIVDIGEELWMYSKNRELLIDEEDKQYLSENLNKIKNQIDLMISSIEANVSKDMLSMIEKKCSDVYDGYSFGNDDYNELIFYIQEGDC